MKTVNVIIACLFVFFLSSPVYSAVFIASDDAFITDFDRDGFGDDINLLYNSFPLRYDNGTIHLGNNNSNPTVGEKRGIIEFTGLPNQFSGSVFLQMHVVQNAGGNFSLYQMGSDGIVTLDDFRRTGLLITQTQYSGLGLINIDVTNYIYSENVAFRFEVPSYGLGSLAFGALESNVFSPPTLIFSSSVPAPSSVFLLGFGLLFFFKFHRKNRLSI